jgi:drug/metabolite transporter (DMT)-like permease
MGLSSCSNLKSLITLSSLIVACTGFSNTPRLQQRKQYRGASALRRQLAVQDEQVDAPASIVFYDDVLDDSLPDGVVCARGVCVLVDFDEEDFDELDLADQSIVDKVLNSYLGPRALLAFASILYGTNFPLGKIMNDALPPSAGTAARMVLASIALSPFLPKLNPKLSKQALLCGCFTALGYTTQSLALITVSPATVAFVGAATVVVCPTLEALVDKKPMSLNDAPQTWLAAILCLMGVAILELYDPSGGGMLEVGWGDLLSFLQAVGFGTSFFLTERMMRGQPDQALPITAVQVSVSAFICMLWCFADGWMFQPGSEAFSLPALFLEPSLRSAAGAVAFTGTIAPFHHEPLRWRTR